ncbi:MAG: carboxypeptidase regulatory-like domain-containing protein, partial [Acidobacteriaceae bacterium]|nr:carboxypeptidase regulatory-like domain-containing protein [Acidobacteriaceae bacterium]
MGFLVRLTLFTLIALTCFAQEGSITGFVHDASGAVIPKATVTVTNSEQGFSRTAITNDSGDYLVPGLVAGTYSIDVKAQGFRQFQVKDLVLRVAEKARTDATLTVGQTSAEITVAGTDVAQIQT